MIDQLSQHTYREKMSKRKTLENCVFSRVFGGRNRTRTCDPIDVNDVLYQLSHTTTVIWYRDELSIPCLGGVNRHVLWAVCPTN